VAPRADEQAGEPPAVDSSQYQIKTITSMVRAYNGPFIRSLSLKAMGPEINTEIMYKAQIMRARVAEIPAHLDWSDQAERMAKRKVSLRVSTTSKLLVFASFSTDLSRSS
jgi:hypothetical protein